MEVEVVKARRVFTTQFQLLKHFKFLVAEFVVDLFFLGLVINIITHIVFIFKTDLLHLIMMSVCSGSEKVTSGF